MFKLTAIKEKSVGRLFGVGGSSSSSNTSNAAIEAAKIQAQGYTDAANIQAKYQQDALNYLQQSNAVPNSVRDQALQQLQGYSISSNDLLNRAQGSNLYNALLSGQEEAALRAQSAAGNLRGGGSLANVGSVQNQALLNAYSNEASLENTNLGVLQGLAGTSTYNTDIANLLSGIGSIYGTGALGSSTATSQGTIAAAQNAASSQQAGFGNLLGLGQLGLGAYNSGLFSDDRLKTNVQHTGYENGIPTYQWEWNEKAADLNLFGKSHGTLASEVEKIRPDAVSMKDGYKVVNYDAIGVKHGKQ